jgi:hypothetical protein
LFEQAIARIDAANAQDPNRATVDGRELPDELLYSQRMTAWLDRRQPGASEALRLAVRAQHICRWMIPRDAYPMTRAGYHAWRNALADFHARKAAEILRDVGYEDATIARVQSLVQKEHLTDAETQALEDAACLVFLEHDFADFATKHAGEEEKLLRILRKTWRKMSPQAREMALRLPMAQHERKLIETAIMQPPRRRPSRDETEEP